MLKFELDEKNRTLCFRPSGPLRVKDFDEVIKIVDPFIEEKGGLDGLLVETESFPGWDSLSAMIRHLKFIKNHHQKIKKVALATDSHIAKSAETFGTHFIDAEIKQFPFGQGDAARRWIAGN